MKIYSYATDNGAFPRYFEYKGSAVRHAQNHANMYKVPVTIFVHTVAKAPITKTVLVDALDGGNWDTKKEIEKIVRPENISCSTK